MKKTEVKEKLVQALNGYVCVNEEILEDIPTLSTNLKYRLSRAS